MSAPDELFGQREPLEGLWRAAAAGRLPHALLFEGPAGVGKFRAALTLVQGLYCSATPVEAGPCGACGPCKRVAARSHPDLFVLDPLELEWESIPVGAISRREDSDDPVCDFLALRAMEGGLRAVVIREFERANAQAQNALLKTLEEPGADSLLILETSRPDLLLETVRSRCVDVRFEGLAPAEAQAVLTRHGLEGREGALLSRWAGGSPGRALELDRQGAPAVRALFAEVLGGGLDPFEACERLFDLPGSFPGRTAPAQTRGRLRAALDLLLEVLRQGLHLAVGRPAAELSHGDLLEAHPHPEAAWRRVLGEVVALRGELELNLPPESIADRALWALADLASPSQPAAR